MCVCVPRGLRYLPGHDGVMTSGDDNVAPFPNSLNVTDCGPYKKQAMLALVEKNPRIANLIMQSLLIRLCIIRDMCTCIFANLRVCMCAWLRVCTHVKVYVLVCTLM